MTDTKQTHSRKRRSSKTESALKPDETQFLQRLDSLQNNEDAYGLIHMHTAGANLPQLQMIAESPHMHTGNNAESSSDDSSEDSQKTASFFSF